MEQRDVLMRLTDQEFDAMMREFDDACGWMLQRIRHRAELLIIDDLGIGGIDAQLGPFFA